jgi:hypothetical protein
MATFRVPSLSLDDEVVPKRTIAYFTRRLQHHLHELVIREFYRLADTGKMTPGRLAKRLDKDPAQITRWLGAPGNWTLDTWAQLMVGIAADPRSLLIPLPAKPSEGTDLTRPWGEESVTSDSFEGRPEEFRYTPADPDATPLHT